MKATDARLNPKPVNPPVVTPPPAKAVEGKHDDQAPKAGDKSGDQKQS
jgi:hypothetical protein